MLKSDSTTKRVASIRLANFPLLRVLSLWQALNPRKLKQVMISLDISLPVVLLVLAFLLKLLIDRASTAPIIIQSLMELPVDIAFLAMSFVVAYTIKAGDKFGEGLLLFIIYIISTIVIVFFWRRSNVYFESDCYIRVGFLTSCNYIASISGVCIALNLIKETVTK